MINNKTIGLVCLDTLYYDKTIFAINQTIKCIKIDKIYWISDYFPVELYDLNIPIEFIKIPKITNYILEYNNLYLNILPYILKEEDFYLNIHSDGFAVNSNSWDDKFLDYDYIGAPWPFCPPDKRVGNGGFSLRSKKLYDALKYIDLKIKTPLIHGDFGEDKIICRDLDEILKNQFGIKFCSEMLACKFSMELPGTLYDYWIGRSFGFHGGFVCQHYGFNYEDLK